MVSNTVTFLGFTFELNPIAFTLPIGGGWSVYWYGIMIALGFLCAFIYGIKKAPTLGINTDCVLDGVLITVPIAVLGARAYYMLFYSPETFFKDFLKIHDGGIAIYGGIIGAFIGIVISCKTRKIAFLDCLDLVAPCFFIGQAIGRWGNFFNQEAFGVNTTLPWGMYSEGFSGTYEKIAFMNNPNLDPNLPVHPCFLYEFLLCASGFIVLHFVSRKRSFRGQLILLYGMIYGTGRFFIESIRTDSLMIGSLRVSQLLSALIVIAAVVLYVINIRRVAEKKDKTSYAPMFESGIGDNLTLTLKDVAEEGTEETYDDFDELES